MEEYVLARSFPQDRRLLYGLIAGIEKYPDFVPGYKSVNVRGREERKLYVTQTVSMLGLETTFDSMATFDPPQLLIIDAFPPGFSSMRIEWRFDELAVEATRIQIKIRYEAKGFLMRRFSRPWIRAYADMQVRAFRERANRLDRDENRSGP